MFIVLFSPFHLLLFKELYSRTIIFYIRRVVCWSMSILYNYAFLPLKSLVCMYSYERKSKQQEKRERERKSDLSRQAWISSLTISIDSTAGNDDEASLRFVCSLEVLLIVHSVYNFTLTFSRLKQIKSLLRFFSVTTFTWFISNFANCLSIDRQTLSFTMNEHYIISFSWSNLLVVVIGTTPLLFSQWYPSWHTHVVHSHMYT